jgi:hypothetical protein
MAASRRSPQRALLSAESAQSHRINDIGYSPQIQHRAFAVNGVIGLQTRLRLAPNVTFRSLGEGEGTVVVDTTTGELYTCNQTGAAFLETIDGQRTFEAIVDALHLKFDVDRAVLRADISDMASQMLAKGLLMASDSQ